jgi:hypothetical protein
MNEEENKTENQKPTTSKLAILSPLMVALSFIILWRYSRFGYYIWLSLAIVGLVLGVAAMCQINYSKERKAGKVSAIFGVIIAIIFLYLAAQPDKPIHPLMVCGTNLSSLVKAMLTYAYDYNGKYPAVDKWCDILWESGKIPKDKVFICPGALQNGNKERCHYAMNPNCEPNSPADTVLLFETDGGWNLSGGSELLSTKNHDEKGCNILYNGGSVEFVRKEKLQDLKWK